ncbi:MAG: D-alanyl-D-alanine carboxypeptidase/D-alanyl-D-alanine-endopeptidase [Solirubrobacterales bacterium]
MKMKPTAAFTLLIALFLAGPARAAVPTPLPNPDLPAKTPRISQGEAGASISANPICSTLKRYARMGNNGPGLRVRNLKSGKTICGLNAARKRSLASNTKIFTTAAALARLGEKHRFKTKVFATSEVGQNGVLKGSLYLKGAGDPSLGTKAFNKAYLAGQGTDIEKIANQVKAAGITKVTGRLFGDASVFDSTRGVADSGFGTSPYIGPLSGLAFNAGYTSSSFSQFSSSPEKLATRTLVRELRKRGIQIREEIAMRKTPASARKNLISRVRSQDMAWMARLTNLLSNNFYAETLLKDLGAVVRKSGTTRSGAIVARRYAASLGADLDNIDGSGLTRGNIASPADVVKFLSRVRNKPFSESFLQSLPTAGVDGTLANRMGGTAAVGNCHAKTGTLTGVSSLSGYCFNSSGRKFAFSILMNNVRDLYAAHLGQDRIAAAIARL